MYPFFGPTPGSSDLFGNSVRSGALPVSRTGGSVCIVDVVNDLEGWSGPDVHHGWRFVLLLGRDQKPHHYSCLPKESPG